jgi:signal peptidase II
MSLKKSLLFVFLILLIDQWSKVYIKTNFTLYESYFVFGQEWFQIYFIENEGMAWGTKIPGDYGKLVLTVFRIIAVFGIGYWLFDSVKKQASKLLIFAICLIFAGAIGNIVDSVFYGLIFNHSEGQIATLFSDEPYGKMFYGKVVDMFYFPLFEFTWPDWMPFFGGSQFRFFNAIFNVADFAISTGIGILLVFNKRVFKS